MNSNWFNGFYLFFFHSPIPLFVCFPFPYKNSLKFYLTGIRERNAEERVKKLVYCEWPCSLRGHIAHLSNTIHSALWYKYKIYLDNWEELQTSCLKSFLILVTPHSYVKHRASIVVSVIEKKMFKYSYVKIQTPLWSYPTLGDHNFNNLQFTLPEDASTHVSAFLTQ